MRALAICGLFVVGACFSKPGFHGGDGGVDAPVVPPMAISAKLAAGSDHACQIDDQGQLWCWGHNDRGQVGPGAGTVDGTPHQVGAETAWTWVSAGAGFTCGIENKKLLCWGANDHGQAAGTAGSDVAFGSALQLPAGEVPARVFAGVTAACAIAESGAAYCWGNVSFDDQTHAIAQLAPGSLFSQIAIGDDHACAIKDEGNGLGPAVCWGRNGTHQLGRDGADTGFADAAPIANASYRFGSIAANGVASCGTTVEGQLVCWGSNQFGSLGDGPQEAADYVVDGTQTWISVTMRQFHVCALTTGGDAYCYGDNNDGALGRGAYAARRDLGAPVLPLASALTAGDDFTCARSTKDLAQGDVWCWGADDVGQLGNKTVAQHDTPVEVALPLAGSDYVHQIVAGDDHTCVVAGPAGGVQYAYCWGRNDTRQVTNGDGTAQPDVIAAPVKATTPHDVSELGAGRAHTCAIESSGEIYCWGADDVGQLGRTGTTMNGDNTIGEPTSGGLWETIAAGANATCAINTAGELSCWGSVPGEPIPLTSPKKYGLSGSWKWEQIAIGSHAIIGVATDPNMSNMKHITGWGQRCQMDITSPGTDPTAGAQSQILDGASYSRIRLAVAQADGGHACAALERVSETTSSIECWGLNDADQVDPATGACRSDATIANPQTVPSVVYWHTPDPTQATVVTAGEHTCALDENNLAYCWGSAKSHALGGLVGGGDPTLFGDQRWFELATGATHTCGIDDLNKHVLCWGQGKFGQLGDGSRYWPVPTPGGLLH